MKWLRITGWVAGILWAVLISLGVLYVLLLAVFASCD